MSLSLVVPVFNGAGTIRVLVEAISTELDKSIFELILVDDGSQDSSWDVICEIVSTNPRVLGLRLGRNAGQHSALLAGVRAARFPVTVTLDDDLQNPPDQIPILVEALDALAVDVVYGVPREASQSVWRKLAGSLVRRSLKSALGIGEALNMSSFRCFRTELRNAFAVNVGPGVSFDALLAWSTTRFAAVEVLHAKRAVGTSNYSFGRLLRFSLDTLTGYTTTPLRVVSSMGFVTALIGLVLMFFFVLMPFVQGISVQGFPFMASIIILFSGLQLVTLGVIGEYLARMHFRIMNKPAYVISRQVGFDRDDRHGS